MLHAASRGHYMSDNALFNFGKQHNDIQIIDAGSRPLTPNGMTKSQFNITCMRKFWKKVQLLINRADLTRLQAVWREAHSMDDARRAVDTLWHSMETTALTDKGSDEHPALNPNRLCPNVTTMLDFFSP